jgi:hypothetical protein
MRVTTSPLFEIALVLVRLDHAASIAPKVNHSVTRTTVENRLTGKPVAQSERGMM